jgi:N-acetylglucosaminyldiphosphoundecaprenol N-acetyl-beta-D-mannosaminyltransferase
MIIREMDKGIYFSRKKVQLFGIHIHNFTLDEAVGILTECLLPGDGQSRYVVTPNATQIVQLRKDQFLRRIYHEADLVVADGMPVIWVSRLLGRPLRERVTGSDLLPRLCAEAAQRSYSVFFLGANPGVAAKAAARLKASYPSLRVAGSYAPPFGFETSREENQKIIKMITDTKPDILFVALGFPKQERWIYNHAKTSSVPLSLGVGAAFDFVAGTLKRAPKWMQWLGLEWLHRLIQEPHRLWRRYLLLGPQFILLSLVEIIKVRTGIAKKE